MQKIAEKTTKMKFAQHFIVSGNYNHDWKHQYKHKWKKLQTKLEPTKFTKIY